MDTEEQIREAVFLYATHNVEKIRKELEPLKEQKQLLLSSADSVFRDEVERQFVLSVKSVIGLHLARALQLDPMQVMQTVEDINLEELLK